VAWLQAAGASSNLVAFDHRAHERQAASCSGCHHQRLTACADCHTLTGSADGDHITLEDAYHRPTAAHSCVGCHERTARQKNCAGCHHVLGPPPGEVACSRCHSGPSAAAGAPPKTAQLPEVQLAPLPSASDDFPETVVIDMLVDQYGPSQLPHRAIVQALDRIVRDSPLAQRFHGMTDTLCAGCHHQSPLGARPPPCRSCHDAIADPMRDVPDLRAAYHRQCIGCHAQMAIEPVGCTKGCHEPAAKEGKR
jgi:hypothetical protein